MYIWTREQEGALLAVSRWLQDPSKQIFRLFGYAGTGKTTLAKYLAEGITGLVLFGAYTAQAASVLRSKGCIGARTIHSLIYHGKEKSTTYLKDLQKALEELTAELNDEMLTEKQISEHKKIIELKKSIQEELDGIERPFFSLNRESDVKQAKLVIIDECSMVDEKMAKDLLSFGVKVLVLGDPKQLKPVGGNGYFTAAEPDYLLTEPSRFALDSPIYWIATKIRHEIRPAFGSYGDSKILRRSQLDPVEVMAQDQLLVGRNETRFACNKRIRQLKGINTMLPIKGDRLVCLRNNNETGIFNGGIYNVGEFIDHMDHKVLMNVTSLDGDNTLDVLAHDAYFYGTQKELKYWEKRDAEEFDYGYALTVHKAQGSQWPKVLVFDESGCFKEQPFQWLYTGVTRAADQLMLAV